MTEEETELRIPELEPEELAWLEARIDENRELLEYLRDH